MTEQPTNDEPQAKIVAAAVAAAIAAVNLTNKNGEAAPAEPKPEEKKADDSATTESEDKGGSKNSTFGFIGEMVAYKALEKLAKVIVSEVNHRVEDNSNPCSPDEVPPDKEASVGSEAVKILITNDLNLVNQHGLYQHVKVQIEHMHNALIELLNKHCPEQSVTFGIEKFTDTDDTDGTVLPPPETTNILDKIASPLGQIEGILKASAEIVGYFKPEFEFSGNRLELPNEALNALVAGQLDFCVLLKDFHTINDNAIIKNFANATSARQQLGICKSKIDQSITKLTAEISADKAALEKKPTDKGLKEKIEANESQKTAAESKQAELAKATALFDAFATTLLSTEKGAAHPPLVSAAITHQIIADKISHYLYLSVLSSGKESIVVKALRLFFFLPVQTIIGSSVATYFLMEAKSGAILASDTLQATSATDFKFGHFGGTRFKNVTNLGFLAPPKKRKS